ncbi:MAG: hypothetical protein ACYS21_06645, partial [Planctomycetota bacterium]
PTRPRKPEKHFLLAWLAITLEGNYFAARMDFRALQNNILQLFVKNTRIFLKISSGFSKRKICG